MSKPRYLTKSRFKTGHDCASKLHYLDDPKYASDMLDDKFLKSLAEGGWQVGELAKIYFEGGAEITEKEHMKAASETAELLKKDNVTIYEAALKFENLFVRVDVLVKKGNAVKLYEVKAKSWRDGDTFTTKKGDKLDSGWEPYIADIAFQRYVAMKAFPQFKYAGFLYLVNKDAKASVSGIHQRFFLYKKGDRTAVEVVAGTNRAELGEELLKAIPVDNEIEMFNAQDFEGRNMDEHVAYLSKLAADRSFAGTPISRNCRGCEYRVPEEDRGDKESGFVKCWTTATKLKPSDLEQPMMFDVWRLHYRTQEKILADGRYFLKDLRKDDIKPEEDDSTELSNKQRQWLQIQFFQEKRTTPYFDADHFQMRARVERWKPPYHFIDFETLTSAIPFHKGMRPYETIAFQFSHHTVDKDGKVSHKAQYLNTKPGEFPNFEFIRELKKTLGDDDGTIFRFAAHENTVLNHIRRQLLESKEIDKKELIQFIESITRRTEDKVEHVGPRNMVDMLDLVQSLYYSPLMGGSNSIKKVLPAVLQESEFLKNKYGQAIYGAEGGINSFNFKSKAWIKLVDGKVVDPYQSLEPLFSDIDPAEWSKVMRVFQDDEIKEGGGASTAYARMQFTRMSDTEREAIANALMRYCELDTLAMVMIWEYWTQELIKKAEKAA